MSSVSITQTGKPISYSLQTIPQPHSLSGFLSFSRPLPSPSRPEWFQLVHIPIDESWFRTAFLKRWQYTQRLRFTPILAELLACNGNEQALSEKTRNIIFFHRERFLAYLQQCCSQCGLHAEDEPTNQIGRYDQTNQYLCSHCLIAKNDHPRLTPLQKKIHQVFLLARSLAQKKALP